MCILVKPCNHWVGYHIVTRLLDEGYQVDGILDKQIDTGLEDFFGRNSHFQKVHKVKNDYDFAIIIDSLETEELKQSAKKVLRIETDSNQRKTSDNDNACISVISVPYLIGEGMKINETGLFIDGQFIPFENNDWKDKAIYIEGFLNVFIQWIKRSNPPKWIEVISTNNRTPNTKVEKKQILLENRDINEVVKKIQLFNKRLP
ncbi:hypothetical protein [Oceanobacillus sp. J11TS1]|uniref:hypothetical protein n=1 Tax=Oceanobacillus sp. J11TS1 TaxID=2807191 RepID=UPI001B0B5675|nr:hypothetical protein [Oceanobacillus sp. J11TS1]GIO24429.1 hypothetical protein J11TS1_30100 [Oceanobacillus sp. J11TS1]